MWWSSSCHKLHFPLADQVIEVINLAMTSIGFAGTNRNRQSYGWFDDHGCGFWIGLTDIWLCTTTPCLIGALLGRGCEASSVGDVGRHFETLEMTSRRWHVSGEQLPSRLPKEEHGKAKRFKLLCFNFFIVAYCIPSKLDNGEVLKTELEGISVHPHGDTRLTALLGEALAMPRQGFPLLRIWKRIEITSHDTRSEAWTKGDCFMMSCSGGSILPLRGATDAGEGGFRESRLEPKCSGWHLRFAMEWGPWDASACHWAAELWRGVASEGPHGFGSPHGRLGEQEVCSRFDHPLQGRSVWQGLRVISRNAHDWCWEVGAASEERPKGPMANQVSEEVGRASRGWFERAAGEGRASQGHSATGRVVGQVQSLDASWWR